MQRYAGTGGKILLFCLSSSLSLLALLSLAGLPSTQAISNTLVISEFRVRGPKGGNDEFIELYNLSTAPVNIGGWKVKGSNNAGTTSVRATIPSGTILNPGYHYLLTNSSTSGGPYSGPVPGNQTYGTGITDDGGIALTLPDDTNRRSSGHEHRLGVQRRNAAPQSRIVRFEPEL